MYVKGPTHPDDLRGLRVNADGELLVSGVSGGGASSEVKLTDGSETVSITNVGGKNSLDVNVTDITLSHAADSVAVGDGVNLVTSTAVGAKRALDVTLQADELKSIIDEPDADTTYVGVAAIGSGVGSAVWQIKKITAAGTETFIQFADGTSAFTKTWNNRATYTYS